MNFNNLRSLKAPLQTYEESNLLSIYLTAWLIITVKTLFLIGGTFGIGALTSALTSTLATSYSFDAHIETLMLVFKVIIILTFFAFSTLQLGYIMETIKFEIKGVKYVMPIWEDNYLNFFYQGIFILIIMFTYALPLILLTNIIDFIQARQFDPLLLVDISVNNHSVYILAALAVVFTWLTSTAISSYVDTNNFLQAYNLRKIFIKIFNHFPYYIAATIFSILYIAIFMFAGFFITFTCLGALFIPLLIEFILPIIILNMFAQVYKLKTDEN